MDQTKIVVSFNLDDEHCRKIGELFPTVKIQKAVAEEQVIESIKEAEILFAGFFSSKIFLAAPKLLWIQNTGAGIEKFLIPEVIDSKVVITNSGSILSSTISEHVFALMLSLARNMRLFGRNQDERKWERYGGYLGGCIDDLNGKTVGIVGFGKTGSLVAEKAKAFGMKIIATGSETFKQKKDVVDVWVAKENLSSLLSESDFVVLTLPLTAETEGLIGESELKCMKKTSYLVNVSRGKIVDEEFLVRALEEKWIGGAALDVFVEEPLPLNSKLWQMDNVVVTPHVAGITKHFAEDVTDVFCENLRRYLNCEPLNFVVDKRKGY